MNIFKNRIQTLFFWQNTSTQHRLTNDYIIFLKNSRKILFELVKREKKPKKWNKKILVSLSKVKTPTAWNTKNVKFSKILMFFFSFCLSLALSRLHFRMFSLLRTVENLMMVFCVLFISKAMHDTHNVAENSIGIAFMYYNLRLFFLTSLQIKCLCLNGRGGKKYEQAF